MPYEKNLAEPPSSPFKIYFTKKPLPRSNGAPSARPASSSRIGNWIRPAIVLILSLNLIGYPGKLAAKSNEYPSGDGKIRIYNYHLNEFAEIEFRKNKALIPTGVKQIQKILRSRDNEEIASVDLRLLDLLDHLQDYFKADTIEIISGYRRQELNDQLLKNGRNVSPRSLHVQGKAIDFHIDEIREETLRNYLQKLNLGGVGYYGPLDFIHVDTGRPRRWGSSGTFARKLIGILESTAPIQLTSDKNDYSPADPLYFTWDFKVGYDSKSVSDIRLEHFWRGKWIACPVQPVPEKKSTLPISTLLCPQGNMLQPFGKYRWTFRVKGLGHLHSSNEFYLKKQ